MLHHDQYTDREDIDSFPYADCSEHLIDELSRLDLLINLHVLHHQRADEDNSLRHYKGLVISEVEITGLLSTSVTRPRETTAEETSDENEKAIKEALAEIENAIGKRRNATLHENIFLPLSRLSAVFHLSPFEEQCLIICIAPELDRRYEKFYGYLHDDVTSKHPSIGLILELLCGSFRERLNARRAFHQSAPLIRYRLLHFLDDDREPFSTILSRPLVIDEGIRDFLLGLPLVDGRLESVVRLSAPEVKLDMVTLGEEEQSQVREFVSRHFCGNNPDGKWLVLNFHGEQGTGRKSMALAICHDLGISLINADLSKLTGNRISARELLLLIGREAALRPAAVCFENLDSFTAGDEGRQVLQIVTETIRDFSRLTFILGNKPFEPPDFGEDEIIISIGFPVPDDKTRKNYWEKVSPEVVRITEGIDFGELAGKFRFTPGQINKALLAARNSVLLSSSPENPVNLKDLHAACRNQSHTKLGVLARKIEPRYGWKDIVLPDDQMNLLQEICNHARFRQIVYGEWGFGRKLSYGKGLNALFSGPPGTGKTMAAEVIASELGLELYKIDLSQVVSKYIGETEKNLDKIFQEAAASNAILFFDEADALFGKRSEVKDAHDRYANIETGYLLQKMEEYEGISILATNLRSNMDEAFVRRMSFIVELPLPREKERRAIWEGIWPDATPRNGNLDLDFIARKFEITGGNIRNIALAAAFLAVDNCGGVEMKHLVHATRREYQKTGKIVVDGEFGEHDF